MKKHVLLQFLLLLLVLPLAWAQTQTVSGRVTSATDGAALPGVTVLERGTSNGVTTGANGEYTLTVQPNATLVFRFIGMATQEIAVEGRTTINVALGSDQQQLGEVVVVGYGTQLKQELTGNIAQVSGEDIANIPTPSLESALQGRAAGVYINQGSGKLGQGINIRIRGAASVSASNQPLYVVDGIPVTSSDLGTTNAEPLNPIADINPNDIASIEILKDASAAAIYGSRASNGVVIITTKRGQAGKTNITFNYYTGFSRPTKIREFLNAEEYIELFSEAIENVGGDPATVFARNGLDINSPYDQNWGEEPFRTGSVSQYEVALSGGNEKTRFYINGNFNTTDGILVGNEFDRASGRFNIDHSISDRVRIGTNVSLIRTLNQRVSDDNAFSNVIQLNALPPIQPKIDPETGELNRRTLYYNNLIDQRDGFNDALTYRTISTAFLEVDVLQNLRFRTEHGIDFLNLQEELYLGRQTQDGGPSGYGYNSQLTSSNYNTNNTLTYNNTFADAHKLEGLLGISYQRANTSSASVEGRGFPSDRFQKIASAARITSGSSSETGYVFASYYARANYVFRDRYLFSGSVRVDGSSRFGSGNRFGAFPAASAGWILTQEPFLDGSSLFSFLKLRASYGLTGNAEISNFAPLALYSAAAYEELAGLVPTSLPSDDLRWEKTKQLDVGIDFGLFNDRITGEVDYYIKDTDDLLLNLPIPGYNGYTVITKNIGKLENKGFEFVLNTQNLVGAFTWNTNFNIAFNRNKVTDLGGNTIFGNSRGLGQIREGEPMGVFWGPKYAGVDPQSGDALYYIEAGSDETTSNYSLAQDQRLGNPNPKFTGGFTNNFSFKGFDLNVLMQFVSGNDVFNMAGFFQSVNGDYFDNQTKDQLNRWQQPGDITDVPQARYLASNGGGRSSRWMQDGSFLRINNVNLGYRLPATFTERIGLESARIYVQATNLATFTDYDGYDPEVNTTYFGRSNVNLGHDFYTPPLAKTFTIGVSIGL
ncbi:TonB-linked SusC/RagA family outer membrane protein [Pontibacter mucosus]|uniref:TonB-linked SusC/RagA family outer membrane protein n=1 Tax=Pontibacter mucosus TaxID=1649266 RepID=A0A2T5YI51_9BACT|nr:TonB-dependent receptor [Pontibacter mucosus]PTX18988.1 TonB-linked SusC/RagA family outer membrane protein [Pontibacter mucosus]